MTFPTSSEHRGEPPRYALDVIWAALTAHESASTESAFRAALTRTERRHRTPVVRVPSATERHVRVRDGGRNGHYALGWQGAERHVVRRVVTGHDERGRSRVVSDDDADAIEYGGPDSVIFHVVWGRDDVAHFPDAGIQPRWSGSFPPPGGCRLAVFEIPPGDKNDLDGYVTENLTEFADPARPGMHASPTTDFDVVLNGTVGLELDEGEVILHPGDVVVLNGTVHRWHNRGSTVATIVAVTIGAHHDAFPASEH